MTNRMFPTSRATSTRGQSVFPARHTIFPACNFISPNGKTISTSRGTDSPSRTAARITCMVAAAVFCGGQAAAQSGNPTMLVSAGTTIYRVSGTDSQTVQNYPNQSEEVIAMTVVPVGVSVADCQPGDVIAFSSLARGKIWRVNNAAAGELSLTQIGTIPNLAVASVVFRNGALYTIAGNGNRWQLNPQSFARIPPGFDLFSDGNGGIGGVAVSPAGRWYFLGQNDALRSMDEPLALDGAVTVTTDVGVNVDNSGLEWHAGALWAGILTAVSDELRVGSINLSNGQFNLERVVATDITGSPTVGFVAFTPPPPACDDIDFNNNTVFPEDADVIEFFNVLAGAECPTCNDIDFNNNTVFPEDQDVIDFFNVLAGGTCP